MAFGIPTFNQFQIAGTVVSMEEKTSKTGKKFAKVVIRDANKEDFEITLFGESSLDPTYEAKQNGNQVIIAGRVGVRTYETQSGAHRTSFELIGFNAYQVISNPVGRQAAAKPADDDIAF